MNKDFKTLSYSEENNRGILSFNRPDQLNALNEDVISELIDFCKEIESKKLSGLIVTGAGEKAFVAGADIKSMTSMSPQEAEAFAEKGQRASLLLEKLPFPVIAAVNGFALGGGLEMALACDFILASENAVFGLPEVSLGLIPGFGGTQRLAKVIGRNRAKEMIFTAKKIKADEAKNIGLALSVHSNKEELIAACDEIIKYASRNSSNAIAQAKAVINTGIDLSNEEGLDVEKTSFGEIFGSYDMKEGTTAFIEKRRPEFKGE